MQEQTVPRPRRYGCRSCGSAALVADYLVPESQGVAIVGYDGDSFEFDYDGATESYDAGPDDGYRCRECGAEAETLEELCGLPAPKAIREAREREQSERDRIGALRSDLKTLADELRDEARKPDNENLGGWLNATAAIVDRNRERWPRPEVNGAQS
jgi:hypothetical protein